MFALAFLIASPVLFILAAINIPSSRVNLTALGLACFVASMLVGRL